MLWNKNARQFLADLMVDGALLRRCIGLGLATAGPSSCVLLSVQNESEN